ncbi:MAG TPA: glutamate--tRNA ligase, partial [Bacillota bacterium]|nr:glutamate--tRNA ligase [Bacillota bacterium]
MFDPARLSTSAAVFDPQKLKWMNGEYIKELPVEQVIDLALPHLITAGKVDADMSEERREWIEDVISLYQEQLDYGAEIVELTDVFFKEEIAYDEAAQAVLEEEQTIEVLQVFADYLLQLDRFTPEVIKEQLKATQKETKHRGRKLFMPVRVATTGQTNGPELPKAISLLGKDVVVARLDTVLKELE